MKAFTQITVALALALAACASPETPSGPDASMSEGKCGDGTCQPDETPATCPADCSGPTARCGDGTCQADETPQSCPADCGSAEHCGDGTCQADETATSCPQDCAVCGDHVCSSTENGSSCPQDCDSALKVDDNSSYIIFDLYVAPCGATTWGNDQLGANVIGVGTAFTIQNIPPGCYNFYANTEGNAQYWETSSGVTLTTGETYTWTLSN